MKGLRILAAGMVANVAMLGSAHALNITPTGPDSGSINNPVCSGGTGSGPDSAWIATYCPAMSGAGGFVYKNDAPSTESGLLAGSYASVVNSDASGGTITYVSGSSLACSATYNCFLLIKDGNNSPYRYAFNLTGIWNGTDTLNLSGFWPDNGAISHWALYGGYGNTPPPPPDSLPEPGTLALFGLGLLGLGMSRRRKTA